MVCLSELKNQLEAEKHLIELVVAELWVSAR